MTLTQFTGDSITHAIPLRWQGSDFEPGTEWLLLWTAKADASDADVDALIQKAGGYGITADGSVASVALVPEDTVEITTKTLLWDIQAQHEGTGEVRTVASGNLRLTRDITREITPSIPINTTEPPVLMGAPGPAPVITVGTVTTGAPGTQAAVEITGTAPNYTLNVTIPAGLNGTDGTDASVTTINIVAAFAASPPSDAQKLALATALGTPVHATVMLANAALGAPIGQLFFNSTLHRYEVTNDIS